MQTIMISGITYKILRTRDFECNGKKRESLYLQRTNGKRVYTAVRYENGSLSSVVTCPK